MKQKTFRIDQTEFFGPFAKIAASMSEEEWAYSSFASKIADEISEYMEKKGITKAQLADRMGKSRPYITKVLRGDANMTLKTFTSLLHHLGAKGDVHISNKNDGLQWMAVVCKRRKSQQEKRASYSGSLRDSDFVSVSEQRVFCECSQGTSAVTAA
jgi:transcriptional regulator with XRE-family HTH domain